MPDEQLESRASARIGTTLRGKYVVDGLLGVGGMAVVYAARHRNGRPVAIKLLHPELAQNPEVRGRFLKEGLAANAVKHPGVVAILDDDVAEDGSPFIVMEHLEGATLAALAEKSGGSLPVNGLVVAGIHLLDVLTAAHAQGVVHRDIKPSNIFVTTEGQLKVLDFGIARVREATNDLRALRTGEVTNVTRTGVVMGTPGFMAPEQAQGEANAVDAATDQWAVGATLFTLAAGRLVHAGRNAREVAIRSAAEPVVPFASVVPGAPESVALVIDKALSFEKANRWPSTKAMRVVLAAAYRETYGGEAKPTVLRTMLSGARRASSLGGLPAAPSIDDKTDVSGDLLAPSREAAGSSTLRSAPEAELGVADTERREIVFRRSGGLVESRPAPKRATSSRPRRARKAPIVSRRAAYVVAAVALAATVALFGIAGRQGIIDVPWTPHGHH